MTQKLEANQDHFDTPQLQQAYIVSHCDGKAQRHITSQLQTESPNPYNDFNEMIEHLKIIYDDLNCVTTAKNQFAIPLSGSPTASS